MKRISLLVVLALVAGCTGQPSQPSPGSASAPGQETGPTQRIPLPDDETANPHPDTDVNNSEPSSKCGEQRERVQQNLRIAAQAKLPVPTLDVWNLSEGPIGIEQFKEYHSFEPTPDIVQTKVEQGEWTFVGKPGIVALLIPIPPEQEGDGVRFKQYAFDPGSLTVDSPVKELAARFHAVLAAWKVVSSTVGAVAMDPGPDKYRIWWGLEPKSLLAFEKEVDCHIQSVRIYQNGRFGWVEIPMIALGNGANLGFAQDRVVFFEFGGGKYTTSWYTVPGIKPLK